ncbi:MAG: hypothetical protein M3Q58_05910 [Bacteroidota bacterium]|nr:hypothetical protein [Bacteroidota bacterium]
MKQIIYITTTLILIFISANSFGQSHQDVVYLKNGSILRGMIIEQVPNKSLKIQTADGNVFAYNMDEIEKISREQSHITYSRDKIEYQSKSESVYILSEFTKGFATVERGLGSMTRFTTIVGYRISPNLSGGIGFGYVNYRAIVTYHKVAPIFVDIRATVLKTRFSPYIYFNGGYSIGLIKNTGYRSDNDVKGGKLLEGGIGFKHHFTNNLAITIGTGLCNQIIEDSIDEYSYKSIILKLGLLF